MNQSEMTKAIEELVGRVKTLEEQVAKLSAPRDRGPKSGREMTDEDAFRVKYGDLANAKHKDAAELLGLSYGQIFSCRGDYTFKHVKADWKKPATTATPPAPTTGEPKPIGPATKAA